MCPDRVVESSRLLTRCFLSAFSKKLGTHVFGVAVYADDSHARGGEFVPARSEMFFGFLLEVVNNAVTVKIS